MRKARLGKSYEEFYGIEKAKKIKEKQSKSQKKAQTGKKHSEKTKRKMRANHWMKNPKYKKKFEEYKKTHPFYKKQHPISWGYRTRFKKGNIPWIKGKKLFYPVWNAGKKGLQHHSEESKEKIRKAHKGTKKEYKSKQMKDGGAVYVLSHVKNPSKPQLKLFNFIKAIYPSSKLNYPVRIRDDKWYSLDVAIPELKINFEYDCPYWHSIKNKATTDFFRDENLIEKGWCVVRIKGLEDLGGIIK